MKEKKRKDHRNKLINVQLMVLDQLSFGVK